MADVSCTPEIPQDPAFPGLTVGAHFALRCQGPMAVMDPKTAEIRLDQADAHKLQLIRLQNPTSGQMDLLVVSYVVGEHNLKAVQLTDAQNSVVLGDLKFAVVSVQDPQQPAKEPFPPMGPMTFFPWFFVSVIVLVIASVGSVIVFNVLRRRRRTLMLKEVLGKVYQSTPGPELFRELRLLQRQFLFLIDPKASTEGAPLVDILRGLNSFFRIYLVRTYLVPAHKIPTAKTLKEMSVIFEKRPDRLTSLSQVMRELDRALENPDKVTGADLAQLTRLIREWVEQK